MSWFSERFCGLLSWRKVHREGEMLNGALLILYREGTLTFADVRCCSRNTTPSLPSPPPSPRVKNATNLRLPCMICVTPYAGHQARRRPETACWGGHHPLRKKGVQARCDEGASSRRFYRHVDVRTAKSRRHAIPTISFKYARTVGNVNVQKPQQRRALALIQQCYVDI